MKNSLDLDKTRVRGHKIMNSHGLSTIRARDSSANDGSPVKLASMRGLQTKVEVLKPLNTSHF